MTDITEWRIRTMKNQEYIQIREMTDIAIVISILRSIGLKDYHPNISQEKYNIIIAELEKWLSKCRKSIEIND
jgi:hypothetical protein